MTLSATSRATNGHSSGKVLVAGEELSSAFMVYCQAEDLSMSTLLSGPCGLSQTSSLELLETWWHTSQNGNVCGCLTRDCWFLSML